ncbi:hypothetical protein CEXT_27881 [Caerostris extrusa]|uniref:Uncharacterized protein n=1 Tax=Caerostris extrusa TaxID=172846 RepID=A0AAV4XJC3_CAEEX|nr:hypothetical protein CEXT_27881 [Caerostris extrusa]
MAFSEENLQSPKMGVEKQISRFRFSGNRVGLSGVEYNTKTGVIFHTYNTIQTEASKTCDVELCSTHFGHQGGDAPEFIKQLSSRLRNVCRSQLTVIVSKCLACVHDSDHFSDEYLTL